MDKLTALLKRLRLMPRHTGSAFDRFRLACLQACKELEITNPAQIAYIFATVDHETNGTFKPVREAYWLSEANLIRWLKRHQKNYWKGNWWGRGMIQLTWERNYRLVDSHLKLDGYLLQEPDLLLTDYSLSVLVAVAGMQQGWFTGKTLNDYINETTVDLTNARRIVNGKDRAAAIAKLGAKYLVVLGDLNHSTENIA